MLCLNATQGWWIIKRTFLFTHGLIRDEQARGESFFIVEVRIGGVALPCITHRDRFLDGWVSDFYLIVPYYVCGRCFPLVVIAADLKAAYRIVGRHHWLEKVFVARHQTAARILKGYGD